MRRMLTSVNTMSSEIRKYELKARAESQRETRDRIARAAAELHDEIGPPGRRSRRSLVGPVSPG